MKDEKPRPPPSPDSLAKLMEFARKIIAVPKSELDARVRDFRARRRRPKV